MAKLVDTVVEEWMYQTDVTKDVFLVAAEEVGDPIAPIPYEG